MHAIRRQAHRVAAATPGDAESVNYNPWARPRGRLRESSLDVEKEYAELNKKQAELEQIQPGLEQIQAIQRPNALEITSPVPSPEEERKGAFSRRIPISSQLAKVFLQWSSALLPLVPAGFALKYTHTNAIAVFCINFVAIVPSAALITLATDEVAIRMGDKVGALLNMTFGNGVQLILSVILLKSRQIDVLRLSLLGTILSNLLLTTGLSFFLGGIGCVEQYFNASIAQTISMLLLLAVTSLVIPTAAHLMTNTTPEGILSQSRGTSIVILISYALWLFFSLQSHRILFNAPSKQAWKTSKKKLETGRVVDELARAGAAAAVYGNGHLGTDIHKDRECLDEEKSLEDFQNPSLSLVGSLLTLAVSVTLVAFNTQFATDSIQDLLLRRKITQTFLGLVILPLISNDTTAIRVAMRDNMDISIALALERCMQTSLLIVPLTVLLAWTMGVNEMTLQFDGFSIATLFASIIIVSYVVQEGRSNWLTGALLIKVFIIIALAAFHIN